MSNFSRDEIVVYWSYGLSHRCISSYGGRDPTAVRKVWNQWVQEGFMGHSAESQQTANINIREDRHLALQGLYVPYG